MDFASGMPLIGTGQHPDSAQAARQAVQMIRRQSEPDDRWGWALAFCGGRHERHTILQELSAGLGDIDIVGGSAVGTISHAALSYTGYEVTVAAFPASLPQPTIITVSGLDAGEAQVGLELATRLCQVANDGDTVLLFYDTIQGGPPPLLYVGSRLMDGLYHGLDGKPLKLIGAGLIGDMQMSGSHVFDGRQAAKHAVVAVVLPSVIESHTTVMHGCLPVSAFLEITRLEAATLYELDGRPALDVLSSMAGLDPEQREAGSLSLSLTIGEKHGDPFAPYDESVYVNRLILGFDPAAGSVTLFEADFAVGTKVQIMSRDNLLMLESVRQRTGQLLASLQGQQPIFALYIDCAGRTCAFSGADSEEASLVQAGLGPKVPLLGFYSGVEIAPLLGRSRPLDWTGVLTLLTLRNELS